MPRPPSVEQKLRDAFKRLKSGEPEKIPQESNITMSNVAKEAGVLPSAFRKERYPDIHREVAAYIEVAASTQDERKPKRKKRKSDAKRIKNLNEMVEKLLAMNNSMRDIIDQQQEEIDMLRQGNVMVLNRK